MTETALPLLVIVEDGAPEEDWHEARSYGVTASRTHSIANGSRKTWRRILDEQLNGSTFRGNRHTRRGHDREDDLIRQCAELPGVVALAPSHALFGAHANPLHRATPDGLGIHDTYGDFGTEVKHHSDTWDSDEIPADHYDQMQFGMHVTGFDWWLYAWGIEGVDGIFHRWVRRDDRRIAVLAARADAYIAWRAAGAPEIDGLSDDIDEALAEDARGLAMEREAKRIRAAAKAVLEAELVAPFLLNGGGTLQVAGSRAGYTVTTTHELQLDDEVWADADPLTYEEYLTAKAVAAKLRADALEAHGTEALKVRRTITENKDAA